MDPLSAFSLACGVIQVVDFSTEVVKKIRELYKDGTLSQYKEAEGMAIQLRQLRSNLELPEHQNHDNTELLKLGDKCSDTAKDLVTELEKLKVSGPHKKRQTVKKTFKTIWKKPAIDEIQKRLDGYRNLIDHRVLTDLRKRFDLLSIQQNEGFKDLDIQVQTVVTNLAQGPKTFEELTALIRNETQSVKEHVTNEFQQHERDRAHREYCRCFLESLWFPEIHRRQEIIHEAHEKTFQWIYEPNVPGTTDRRWDSFVHWLESGQHTYWINGKAGSGKSTLMSYIYQEDRTAASLKVWSGSKDIFTPGFFFWNAGEGLEKSSDGLLRSLIYQLLKRFPSLTPSSQIVSSSELIQGVPSSYEPIAAWTERRLLATFETVLCQAQEACRICVFIDGLDEFSGDQEVLMKLIGKVQTADVKVCLSSRPYRSYSEAFGSFAKLQLQDLTESDIRLYVSDKLHPLVKTGPTEGIHHMFDTVVFKAEGVFLWVELVVKDLIKGLQEDDTLEQLQERLSFMPSDIEDLYTHMLDKIDKVYRRQAAKLFQTNDWGGRISLFIYGLAHFSRSKKISDVGLNDIIAYCEEARTKIPTICAGLLEVHVGSIYSGSEPRRGIFRNADPSLSLTIQYAESSELAQVDFLRSRTDVEFSHRTARDYLEQSKPGKQFMDTNSVPDFNPRISHVNALLTEATLLGFASIRMEGENDDAYDDRHQDRRASLRVENIMAHVGLVEGLVQTSLCDDIDCTLAAIYSRHGLPSHKILRDIMENTSVAERQNGTAQISICADYEDVLANLNQRSPSKAHWSVRWSSTWSFHSANMDTTLLENSRVLPTRPVDFVGVAASWGLSHYVEQKLLCQSKTVDQDTANYLLCCTAHALRNLGEFWDESLERHLRSFDLVPELLKLGADCNIYVEDFSNTLWGDFLTQTTWILEHEKGDFKRACVTLTKAYLEHGADVHVRVYREVVVGAFGLGSLDVRVVPEFDGYQEFTFIETNTALYAVQEHFDDMPEFDTLEKEILKKGGSSSSRWTHFAPKGFRLLEISEQQSDDFKAAFRAYGADDDGNDESIQTCKKGALQIARLHKEICGDNEDTDKFGPSKEYISQLFASHEKSRVEAWAVFRADKDRYVRRAIGIQI